jgi:thymidylate synthase (FAD)
MSIDEQKASEIAEAREQLNTTLRPTVQALEERLHHAVPCLDHGFVRVVDYMGDDAAVVQAARVSYGRGTRKLREDRGLIRYLMRHRHTTPFEMCELKLHVKLPIFVARQWIRHRTASVNEISGRYSVLDSEFYTPATADLAVQSSSNRQGRGAELSAEQAAEVLAILQGEAAAAHASYAGLMENYDLARELARINLTLSTYTQWYWKIDLHNLLHFLALRMHPHAQREFRVYAQAMASIVAEWVPASWEAFEDYRLGSYTLSRQGVDAVKAMLAGQPMDQASSGLSKREWNELLRTFEIEDRG